MLCRPSNFRHESHSEAPRFRQRGRESRADRSRRWFICRAMLLVLAIYPLLGASDQPARVNDLGHRMMCVCGCNQILLECNHVGCAYSERMRNELIAAVDRGENDDLTLQVFVQKYGPTVMAAPGKTGFNRVAWITPYLALALGLTLVIFIVRAWRFRPLVLPAGAVAPVHGPELERFRKQARRDTEI
jgi:cytochrome c-type biogenesis protein CcmH/NrfF